MKVIAFDVNETLLDMAALDPVFTEYLGAASARREWFQETLQNGFVTTITGWFVPFPKLARAALETIEQRYGKTLTDADRERILGATLDLPPHPEVVPALQEINKAGFTVVALGNNIGENLEKQFRNAKIWEHFRHIFGADTVQRMKPAKETYHFVSRTLNVAISDVLMVSAHSWDVAGALAAGLNAAFVARPGQQLSPLVAAPLYQVKNLTKLADKLSEAAAQEQAS